MRVAVVFGNNGSDPRVIRTCRSLRRFGHETHFIGWDRQPQLDSRTEAGGAQMHVLRCATKYGHSTFLAQCRFTAFVARQLAHLRPAVVCAINEENAVRVLPLKGIYYGRLVCDVLDSHRDVHSEKPYLVRVALSALAEIARTGSNTLIATDRARYELFGRHRKKTKIISNYPEDPGDALSRQWPMGPTQLYVSGTLTESRGLGNLLEACEGVDNLQVVAAGWPNDAFAQHTFLKHPQVKYLGSVALDESLDLASRSDAVFAFYSPTCRNNILASPNKIYEAMAVGRPSIINSEAQVGEWVAKNSLGFSCPYADVVALRKILLSLRDARKSLPDFSVRARERFVSAHSWEKMEEILSDIYGCADQTAVQGARLKAA